MSDNYMYHNQNLQNADGKMNRVYINPNFNLRNNYQTNKMYVNPNFPQVTPNMCNLQQSKEPANSARIHVNPNFIRNANMSHPIVTNNTSYNAPVCPPTTSCNELKSSTESSQKPTMHVAKSRYCLVRQKENLVTPISTTPHPVKATVRVNKYKSVSLNVVKNIIASAKPTKGAVETGHAKKIMLKAVCNDSSRYKFVKPSTSNAMNNTERKPTKYAGVRRGSLLNKSISRSPKINSKLKKNNIPCPLFKKYGTCLRKLKGRCEYLHDKKHVSICRKFLKGVCHDSNCLLSHDLTDKKMPTCYFYLQGACTKENCPYLHVKLNEKTKLCQDFLKGYCEKGDKCLLRHVCVSQGPKSNKVSLRKQLPYSTSSKSNHVEKVKSRKKYLVSRVEEQRKFKKDDMHQMEQRYFKEMLEDESTTEKSSSIKPHRVKLGTLPSFIQL